MPSGFQNRFTYGSPIRSFGTNSSGVTWDVQRTPLIGYEAIYGYRSGKRAKEVSQAGNYTSLVRSGSLSDQLRRRTEFLNQQIRDELLPNQGNASVFCYTGDTGHPLSIYKLRATQIPIHVTYRSGVTKLDADVCLDPTLPYPDFAFPFGDAFTNGQPTRRFTYFAWPSVGNYLSAPAPSVSNQLISNVVKNNIASGIISSANPWKPKASLAQTILELLSGDIPTVFTNLRRYVQDLQNLKKSAGSDWLNIQFGWVPLANDIRATVQVLLKLHMLLYGQSDSYRRTRGGDLGSWARVVDTPFSRGLSFNSPLNTTSGSSPYLVNPTGGSPLLAPPPIPSGLGDWSRSCRVQADFRFSAKYHRGARPNSRERGFLERATELLGLEVTPAVLWELTPWTWLLDWGSNLGSVASNLSLLDWSNVLLDYAYLTFVVKTTGSVSVKLPFTQISSTTSVDKTYLVQGFESIEKVREQASPYGFSVSWDGLSPFQLSILAALGMSRGR